MANPNPENVHPIPGPPRAEATEDDLKQLLTVALAAVQRERAAADQWYVRGRNLVAMTATLFAAVQAAFIASLGRTTSGDHLLLTAHDRSLIVLPAVGAGVLLLIAIGMLFLWADRGRDIDAVGSETLLDVWHNESGTFKNVSILESLLLVAVGEESGWSDANSKRKTAVRSIGYVCTAIGLVLLSELAALYLGLT